MSATQIGIFLSIFICTTLIVVYKWDTPFKIENSWLNIIGGFPCLLYSSYDKFEQTSPRGQFPSVQPSKRLIWNCDKYLLENHCLSTLSQCPEKQMSQFSVDFWSKKNVTCRRNGRRVKCLPIVFEDNTCKNMVVSISNYTNNIELHLADFQPPLTILQKFESSPKKIESCYKQLDALEFYPETSTASPLDLFGLRFKVNSTFRDIVKAKDCSSLSSQLEVSAFRNILLCNCGKCDISIYIEKTPRNGTCVVPIEFVLTIPVEKGRITGAVLRINLMDVEPSRPLPVIRKVLFVPYASTTIQTRFWLIRGRFYCPSEVTCWEELWYPLKEWTRSYDIMHIYFILIIAGFVALALWRKN